MPEPTEEQQIADDTPSDGLATCGAVLVDVGFDPLGGRWARTVGRVFLAFGALIVAFILAAILGAATGSIIVAMLPVVFLIVGCLMKELLWSGCVGGAAEISSAKELRSEGCVNQAWSAATFIELKHALKKNLA